MSFPTKAAREGCWGSRDVYWECLDKNDVGPDSPCPPACLELKKAFESSCPNQWVKHFNRKRDYDIFKRNVEAQSGKPGKPSPM